MTEKDKDRVQKALVAAWEIRDRLRDSTTRDGLTYLNDDNFQRLQHETKNLIVELAVLSSNVIGSITKLEAEMEGLQDKLEGVELNHSSLEDEVAALQTEVQELKASED